MSVHLIPWGNSLRPSMVRYITSTTAEYDPTGCMTFHSVFDDSSAERRITHTHKGRVVFFYFIFFSVEENGVTWLWSLKNHHYICLRPLFRPHDSPVRGIKVTELDLNSPWELPRSGSYSTPALESPVGFLLY